MSARVPLLPVLALSSAALLLGCDASLKSESLIEETRVIGARVEVAGDPLRGSPAPGESARLRFFVAAPDGMPNVAYALSLCGAAPTNSGFPNCEGTPFAAAFQGSPSFQVPELDFDVPTDIDARATPHGFASGVVCAGSAAELTSDGLARCAGGPGGDVAFEFDFAGSGEDNNNPTFAPDSITFDGATWALSDPQSGCGSSLTEAHAGTRHSVSLRMQNSDFDPLLQVNPGDPARETLLLSQFCSA